MTLLMGDCLDKLKAIKENSVDSVVTDPPYGLKFMAKHWDYDVPSIEIWKEVLRVLKPGGHALIACGTRTQHRMAVNIEDAGFEIRDVVTWLYGQGFPKSHDVSKAIDKAAGANREVVGVKKSPDGRDYSIENAVNRREFGGESAFKKSGMNTEKLILTAPSTDAAKQWQGWGTALKPACEFWTLVRKPLSESTVASNVLKWGTGSMNIEATRVEYTSEKDTKEGRSERKTTSKGFQAYAEGEHDSLDRSDRSAIQGRFPANLIIDKEAGAMLDADSGGASRFFYCPKASKSERGEGNGHPTIKPIKLMDYLIKLITPPGGIVLDPFMGSGSTGVAAANLGFKFIGIEREKEYLEIAKRRIASADYPRFDL